MKQLGAIAIASCLLGSACSDAADAPFQHVRTGVSVRDHARLEAARAGADRLMQAFEARHGRKPSSIEELERAERELPRAPEGYTWSFDAERGALDLVEAGSGR